MRSRLAAAWVSAALLGCAATPPAEAPAPPRRRPIDVGAIAALVSSVRGLPQRAAVPIALVDDERFFAAVRENVRKKSEGLSGAGAEELERAFELAPPGAGGAGEDAVVDEQLVAYYDEYARGVFVRETMAFQRDDDATDRQVIVHEVEHALQHQNLPFPNLAAIPGRDARLAHKAVLEGDAMVTQIAVAAVEGHESVPGAIVRAMARVHSGRAEEILRASGSSRALLEAPARDREPLLFSYFTGLTFMGDVHRAGGFALMDRVFASPPTTTEQVIHPEKYFAGEQPIEIAAPPAPPGHRVVATGRLGELQTGAFLAQRLPIERARAAAVGWGGDTFSVVVSPDRSIGLLWSTAWDTEAAAIGFERALREAVEGGAVARKGARVALARGIARDAARVAESLLELPQRPSPARPPLGAVRVASRPTFTTAPATLQRGWFMSPRLGLWASVPYGFAAELNKGAELSIVRKVPTLALGAIEVSMALPTPAGIEHKMARAVADFEGAARGRRLVELSRGQAATPIGPAHERVWSVGGTYLRLRVLLVPFCGGAGSVMITQSWVGPEAKAALDAWLGSLRPASPEPPPVCAELAAR